EVKMADGRTLYTTEKQRPVTLWELASGRVVKELLLEDGGGGPVAFSAGGERFAVASAGVKDPKIAIYSTATGERLESIDSQARCLCFAQDGKSLVAGQANSTALVWQLQSGAK
ncbi:MAG TPA: hypothetical protein VFB80_06795, partial [Pirellulaceae bacterium]|nr:hypothetical protein [Pirellulaceae bacterium]